jgi:hypothetical protein
MPAAPSWPAGERRLWLAVLRSLLANEHRERGERRPSVARACLPTSKLFCQTFPNFGQFSPRISKESFGGFVEFQGVKVDATRKSALSKFLSSAPLIEPVARSQTRLDRSRDMKPR